MEVARDYAKWPTAADRQHFVLIITDGQKIISNREAIPTNPKVKAPPDGMIFADLQRYMDEGAKWSRLFRETFATR
jgi:hypothetical protein